MLKYKIKEKELNDIDEKDIIQVTLHEYNVHITWLYLLIDIFTTNFGIMKYICKFGRIENFVLFGIKTDVECVIELINHAYNFAEEKANKYAREHREIFGTAKGVKNSWFEGFVAGIKAKYDEQNKQEEFALMLQIDKDVEDNFSEFTSDFIKKERVIKSKSSNHAAEYEGYKAGRKFGTTPLPDVK